MNLVSRLCIFTGSLGLLAWGCGIPGAVAAAPTGSQAPLKVDFNHEVRPILAENCFACHGPDEAKRKARLRLDLRESAVQPAKSGSVAIVPGVAEKSELMLRTSSPDEEERMPPLQTGKALTPGQLVILRRWIDQGAEYQTHRFFLPPQRPERPVVSDHRWPRNPIDDFVLARLEQEGVKPAPEADRRTLVRRLKLDLLGLPPTPAEVEEFVADSTARAYDRLVDRFLSSPHYGERMAVDWLDAARFADTHGYHIDAGRDMTHWRDWVISAYNRNQPFDQFTIEQIAGDLLPNATREQRLASGFNRNHMINFEGGAIPEEYHAAYLMDRVNTTTRVWLGLTVACAQCHDHKYDPITQKDYYRLFAFFNSVPENGLDGSKGNAVPLLRLPAPQTEQKLATLSDQIGAVENRVKHLESGLATAQAALEQEWSAGAATNSILEGLPESLRNAALLPAAQRSQEQQSELKKYVRQHAVPGLPAADQELAGLRQQRDDLERTIPTSMVMQEMDKPRDSFVLERGQYDKLGEKVTPGIPAMFGSLPEGGPTNRLGLARWLVAPSNPLTARVMVNRFWQMYFGTGIVKTAEDFGTQGEWPSHPELLDWLASEFVRSGWDVKAMQKLMVGSATYRQSSATTREWAAKDPENRLMAHGPRQRLQAEFIRDQALAISGLLNEAIGGPSVSPYQPAGLWEELASREDGKNWTAQTYTQSHGPDLYRRTMYTFWKRTSPPPTLSTFDAPDRETCTVRRLRTNTPLQALILMNDPTYVEASRRLAERLLREAPSNERRVALAFQLALARPPAGRELALLLGIAREQLEVYRRDHGAAEQLLAVGEAVRNQSLDPAELAAWTIVASVLLNLDETITKG